MSSIIMRSRACLRPPWWMTRAVLTTQRQCRGPQCLPNVSLCFPNSRFVSSTRAGLYTKSPQVLTLLFYPAHAHYPRHTRGQRNKNDKLTTKHSKVVLNEAQKSLEKAALIVTEVDERISKELSQNASFETYVKLTLYRLRPFLLYFVYHGPEEFLKGYAKPTSSMARARIATVYLFISAHAWLFRATAARSSGSQGLPPEVVKIAEQFNKTGNVVEAFVENKLPEGMTWADVGGAILDSSSDAWFALSKIIAPEAGAPASDEPSTRYPQKKESPNEGDDRI